jgi:hypothetical protein
VTDTPAHSEDDSGIAAMCVITVIVSRKLEFVGQAARRFRSLARADSRDVVTSFDRDDVTDKLCEAIANLSWRLFVTESEAERRKLNPQTTLENLDRAAIWAAVERELGGVTDGV